MTESVENLILEHLRAIRADIGTLKDDNVFIEGKDVVNRASNGGDPR